LLAAVLASVESWLSEPMPVHPLSLPGDFTELWEAPLNLGLSE